MAMNYEKEIAALKASMDEMKSMMKKHYGTGEDEEKKEEMAADDMIVDQFAEESGEGDGVHIDIDSHGGEEEEEMDEAMFPAARPGKVDTFALRRENARQARELRELKAEFARERFSRELDLMEQEGYRIPASHRPRLLAELAASSNAAETLEAWRDLFARDPMGVRIDMSRAALPQGDIKASEISDLVREYAGKPEEFKKAINSRIKR